MFEIAQIVRLGSCSVAHPVFAGNPQPLPTLRDEWPPTSISLRKGAMRVPPFVQLF
jgi:hypothetical protein